MSGSERKSWRTRSPFPKKWSIHLFRSIILSGYVAGICSNILSMLNFCFLEPAWCFIFVYQIVLIPIYGLIDLPPYLILAISWLLYFKSKREKSFDPHHAWCLIGGWSMITIPIVAIHWIWGDPYHRLLWWSWPPYVVSTIEHLGGQDYPHAGVAYIAFWIAQLPNILLGTMIGGIPGYFSKKYPSRFQILLVLLGVVAMGIVGALWSPGLIILGIFYILFPSS